MEINEPRDCIRLHSLLGHGFYDWVTILVETSSQRIGGVLIVMTLALVNCKGTHRTKKILPSIEWEHSRVGGSFKLSVEWIKYHKTTEIGVLL